MNLEDKREILFKGSYDVIVVGGGIAGICAAVAAAREKSKVLIIEKNVAFGGLATIGCITWYEPLCDCHSKQMIAGIPEELLKLSIKYGFDDLNDCWKNGKKPPEGSTHMYATHYSQSMFIMALDKYVEENGITIRFDTQVAYPVMENNHCVGVVTESKSGKEFFEGKVIIDATGDASVMNAAGVPCVLGENYFSAIAQGFEIEDAKKYIEDGDARHLSKWYFAGSDMKGNGQGDMKLFHGDDADEITEFLIKTRKATFDKVQSDNPKNRDISRLPMMPTFRTIRHIVGEYSFSGNDENVLFKDSVGSCADFRQKGKACRPKHYHIPYSCMYNKKFDNLIACGRIVDCDTEGWEITRVIPVAALTGQAAGTAGALAVKKKTSISDVDICLLQSTLKNNGVLFND